MPQGARKSLFLQIPPESVGLIRKPPQRVNMLVLCSSCRPPTCDALAVLMAHADLHGDRPSSMLNLLRHQLSARFKFRFIGAHGAAGDCAAGVALRDAISSVWPCIYSNHVRGFGGSEGGDRRRETEGEKGREGARQTAADRPAHT